MIAYLKNAQKKLNGIKGLQSPQNTVVVQGLRENVVESEGYRNLNGINELRWIALKLVEEPPVTF